MASGTRTITVRAAVVHLLHSLKLFAGMVHYISLDTETDLGHGLVGGVEDNKPGNSNGPFGLMNEQIEWLENDLKNVDRKSVV